MKKEGKGVEKERKRKEKNCWNYHQKDSKNKEFIFSYKTD